MTQGHPPREYRLRLRNGHPIALIANGRIILGHEVAFDKEIWVANQPESQAVSICVDYFQRKERRRRTLADVSRNTRAELKQARKLGASISQMSKTFNLKDSVVKACLRA